MDNEAREIRRRSAEMLHHMTKTRDELREVQVRMPPRPFKQWVLDELSMDDRTLQDVLAFDGTMDGMTERMIGWIKRSKLGGRLS
jgi:hypothetical protein